MHRCLFVLFVAPHQELLSRYEKLLDDVKPLTCQFLANDKLSDATSKKPRNTHTLTLGLDRLCVYNRVSTMPSKAGGGSSAAATIDLTGGRTGRRAGDGVRGQEETWCPSKSRVEVSLCQLSSRSFKRHSQLTLPSFLVPQKHEQDFVMELNGNGSSWIAITGYTTAKLTLEGDDNKTMP